MNNEKQIENRFLEVFAIVASDKAFKSQAALARRLDMSPQLLTEILKGRTKLGLPFLQKFFTIFNVNPGYIFLGEGPQFQDNPDVSILRDKKGNLKGSPKGSLSEEKGLVIHEPKGKYEVVGQGIPFYDAAVMGGQGQQINDNLITKPTYYIDLPRYRDCDVAYRLHGYSMEPEIQDGDLVLGRWVKDKAQINYGDIYLVITPEMSVTKILRMAKDPSKIILASINREGYDDYELSRDAILRLAKIKVALKDL